MKEYHKNQIIPFDVPGHKHGRGLTEFGNYFGARILELDVNSMKCLDNISNPVGVIKEAEELMAEAYSADHAFFLVNGTTAGVQAMILSACMPGEKLILPRNAHKSAINGLIISGALPVYLQPEIDDRLGISLGVTVESVEKAIIENPDAKAVFIINPTYYGMVSDIKRIIEIAHGHGMAVLLDEAHGAHFNFNEELPVSGLSAGADMAAASLHKTGGSLTQSSVLLMNDGLIDPVRVKTNLNLMQTTSASYLLMGSLDLARKNLAVNGKNELLRTIELARRARKAINGIPGLYAFGDEMVGRPGVYVFDET
ncbi:MAG: arginine decarboxylase, partial [Clostridiales bacterium]